ncbi:MAG: long-chain fatty acid--CoA ligase [Acidobacteria bacterium]|nr:MAG: long-chain fatty acid--CoA ligase [Acidobacteriota bacterium]REK09688.1 MAG: long-chain fatty acid--CoA ligase [Acidobacteriota bacterium]
MTPPVSESTLPGLLQRNAEQIADLPALREKEFGIWQTFSWQQARDRVRDFALGLEQLGLRRGQAIAILGDNRPEWVIAELAAQSLGGVAMGLYQDSAALEIAHLVEFAECEIVVAEDQEQVDKLLEAIEVSEDSENGEEAGGENGGASPAPPDPFAKVRWIITFDPRGLRDYDDPRLLRFEQVEERGRARGAEGAESWRVAVAATQPDDVALFATTSGTTGRPKLAMLSHRNLLTMAESFHQIDPMRRDAAYLSFLPLAWIGEQMIGVACGLAVGFAMSFPEEPETVQLNLREIGPHMMFSPPRIWENLQSEVQVKIEDTSRLKRWVYERALRAGYARADGEREGASRGAAQRLRDLLAEWSCHVWLRDHLGLRRVERAYTGGAALGPDVFRFFHAIGVNLKQIYGQTEVSGISVAHRDDDIRYHTVGVPVPGVELKLADDGEILARGPAVFQGYFKNPEATAETLQGGWLHSGDAGMMEGEHLVVIDRKKDVMTLGDGTRFSPQFIENKLKFSPYVREAVVFGGGSLETITAMITIDFANTGTWAERRHLAYTTFTDLSQKPEVYALVRAHVERMNQDLPVSARVRRFLLLHKELDADDEELTRTRKVRRGFVAERYRTLVDGLYGSSDRVAIRSAITYQDGSSAEIDTELKIETLDTGAGEAGVASASGGGAGRESA